MSSELTPIDHYEKVNEVVDLFIKGYNPSQIAVKTGRKRRDVVQYIDDWKAVVSNDPYIKARALDTVSEAVEHYKKIKHDAWDVADRAKSDDDRKVELQALGLAASITKQEFEHLRAAGIMQDEDITEQMIEIEQQKQKVVQMLRDVAPQLCEKDRKLIAEELAKLSGKPEVVPID